MRLPLLPLVLLLGCQPTEAPPLPTAPAPILRFLSPSAGAVENPVEFRVQTDPDVVLVRYVADGLFTLGTSEDRGDDFAFGMDFAILGEHTMEAEAFDANGSFVADARITIEVSPDPSQRNELGTFLARADLDAPDYTHDALADRLATAGVKRAYLPVGAGAPSCETDPVLCDRDATDAVRARGVEPWAWMRAEAASDGAEQAETIRSAVPAGFHGLVIELGDGYDDDPESVTDLLAAMLFVRSQCDTTGLHLGGNFPLYLATPRPPWERGLPLDSMDDAVDGYLPSVRLDEASPAQLADPGAWMAEQLCAWRTEGTDKPVHAVLSALGGATTQTLDALIEVAGREASVGATPGLSDDAEWERFAEMNWWGGEFATLDCPEL